MTKSCRECGADLDDAVHYCGTCGARAISSTVLARLWAQRALVRLQWVPTKVWLGSAAALALIVFATTFWLWLRPPASVKRFTPLVEAYVRAMPAETTAPWLCDHQIAYAPVVEVGAFDARRQLLEKLGVIGVYEKPLLKTVGDGANTQTRLVFKATEAGQAAIHEGKLCAATGFRLAGITLGDHTEKLGNVTAMKITAQLAWQDPLPWTQDRDTQKVFPALQAVREVPLYMARTERVWRVMTDAESAAAQ